ncbi:hypothetical protein [Segetibacter aerophilus]|uniref:Uncharacterized protein n=1 Tax=Segetibacter aerophilus TaxID=670293 RepID=A0A512BDC7_9BACT|nr:hypothetical protein [Segetibacter aerophilus]GEO09963.1 hypothetical protein SAE01_24590 [Segetibacter aerophilus]
MRKLVILFVITCISNLAISQNAFYNAKELAQLSLDSSIRNTERIVAILVNYLSENEAREFAADPGREKLRNYFKEDPAIIQLIDQLKVPDISCDSILKANLKWEDKSYVKIYQFKKLIDTVMADVVFSQLKLLDTLSKSEKLMNDHRLKIQSWYKGYIDSTRIFTDTESIKPIYIDVQNKLLELKGQKENIKNVFCEQIVIEYKNLPPAKRDGKLKIPEPTGDIHFKEYKIVLKQLNTSAEAIKAENQQASAPGLSMPTQTQMVDAVAIYLANRVKYETAITFLEYIKKALKTDSTLLNLFPETLRLFTTYNSYEMPNFGNVWQQAFAEDFIMIPQRIASFKNTDNYFYRKYKNSPTFNFIREAIELPVLAAQKGNIIDIVELLNERYKDTLPEHLSVFNKFIRLFHLINDEFYSIDRDKFWVSYIDLNKLTPQQFRILSGLLFKKYKDQIFSFLNISQGNWDRVDSAAVNQREFKKWLGDAFYVLNQFQTNQQALNDFVKSGNVPKSNANFWRFLPELYKTLVSDYQDKSIFRKTGPFTVTNRGVETYKELSDVFEALEGKDYSVAFDRTLHILEKLMSETRLKEEKALFAYVQSRYKYKYKKRTEWEAVVNGNQDVVKEASLKFIETVTSFNTYSSSKTHADSVRWYSKYELNRDSFFNSIARGELKKYLSPNITDGSRLDRFVKDNALKITDFNNLAESNNFNTITRTVSFISDVRRAPDSKTLSQVISSYASPPVSYKQKRSSNFSIDLNAFVGIYGGYEGQLKQSAFNLKQYSDFAFSAGVSAPIGVSCSWGYSKPAKNITGNSFLTKKGSFKSLKENNFSITISIIDIGAPVSYRLSKGSAGALPNNVTFGQLISPGLFAQWGIRNTPLCFSAGVQYTPELRTFDAAKQKQETAFSLRAGMFFDLPLMNIIRH